MSPKLPQCFFGRDELMWSYLNKSLYVTVSNALFMDTKLTTFMLSNYCLSSLTVRFSVCLRTQHNRSAF